MESMEEWGFPGHGVMQRSFDGSVCCTCRWFTYGMDKHCRTVVGCALLEAQLAQGDHLTHRCSDWSAVTGMKQGGTVAA